MATAVENYPLQPGDLLIDDVDEALAKQEITAVVARAALIAPCILHDGMPSFQAARGILIDVACRRYWLRKRGQTPGVSSSEAAGGRSQQADAKGLPPLFWPSEIAEMQAICTAANGTGSAATGPVGSFPDAQRWPDPAWPC